jgi:hypothetical protein
MAAEIFNEARVSELIRQYQTAATDRDREVIWPLLWRETEGLIAMLLKKVGPIQLADYEDLISALKIKFLKTILPRFDASRGRAYTLLYVSCQRAIWTQLSKRKKQEFHISCVGNTEDLIKGFDYCAAPHDSTIDELTLCD